MPVSETFRPCVIIPTYNHWQVLPKILAEVRSRGLAIYIIDDGSDSPCAEAVKALHDEASQIIVSRHEPNRGKGFAVMQGFELASKAGFTHALQIDADGQHDLAKIDTFLATARRQPDAVISGQPVYDTSIPTGRKIGRWITHIWVFIETLSLRITDSMCGFRVYPLEQVMALKAQESIGSRMDFDVEIMVRLFWRGVAPVMIPVKVTYPPGNISNFRLWRDNASGLHNDLAAAIYSRQPAPATRGTAALGRHQRTRHLCRHSRSRHRSAPVRTWLLYRLSGTCRALFLDHGFQAAGGFQTLS